MYQSCKHTLEKEAVFLSPSGLREGDKGDKGHFLSL